MSAASGDPPQLVAAPLTREAFAPFGHVFELEGAHHYAINGGTTERFHDLLPLDTSESGGRTLVNVFRGQPHSLPVTIRVMERHPMGSQAFIPLDGARSLIVVAPPGDFDPTRLVAFVTSGLQGVSYARGVWHHYLLALERTSDFLVLDRGGPGANCDEVTLEVARVVVTTA